MLFRSHQFSPPHLVFGKNLFHNPQIVSRSGRMGIHFHWPQSIYSLYICSLTLPPSICGAPVIHEFGTRCPSFKVFIIQFPDLVCHLNKAISIFAYLSFYTIFTHNFCFVILHYSHALSSSTQHKMLFTCFNSISFLCKTS